MIKRKILLIIACLFFITNVQQSFADPLTQFDISSQQADKAIILFAQQTNQTILFSFELTKNYQVNEVKGFYPIDFALKKLLKNTGLTAKISPLNQISIELAVSEAIESAENTIITETEAAISDVKKQPTQLKSEIEKIAITGTRVTGRLAKDLPVPVDIFSSQTIENTGQTEVGKILQTLAPSFNFSSSAISDGSDVVRPATLRGLGPDQTLVLINGRRRHQASLTHINTSVGRGTAGTDMNAIPAAAIKRIEVLRDGASAQYGSDAIAGVINIVLKDNDDTGKISTSYGQYAQGDGAKKTIDITKGFSINDKGFVNTTFTFHDLSFTNRAGLNGACQYPNCSQLPNSHYLVGDPRENNTKRDTFRIGEPNAQQTGIVLNAGYNVGEGELYGFATYSYRDNQSALFFRENKNYNSNALLFDGDATIPSGFLPKINSTITDFSYSLGYETDLTSGEHINLAYTYGKNTIDYTTVDTINSSYANYLQYSTLTSSDKIRDTIPRQAFAYGLGLSLQTLNMDITKDFQHFSLALGAELRTDSYQITAGDEYAYKDYDTENGQSLFPDDRGIGTQGFAGISPDLSVNEKRNVFSFYADIDTQVTDNLLVNAATRYDHYQGFDGSTNFKLAAKWLMSEKIKLRGSVSTGFRAPSMQQLYFNNISTQYISAPNQPTSGQIPVQVNTLNNESPLAQAIGFKKLKEESATNYSLGTVIEWSDDVNLAIDWYAINIEDRIVISNKITDGLSPYLSEQLIAHNTEAAQFFLNGANTETKGVDVIMTWTPSNFNQDLSFTLAANVTDTDVVDLLVPIEPIFSSVETNDIFSQQDISIIEDWQPKNRMSLNTHYQLGHWSFNLMVNRYGEYTITDGGKQEYGAEILTDLHISYAFSNGFSFNIGSNNLFDVYPDKNTIGNANSGTIEDENGNILVSSTGVFTYSRRSAPFGFNGAYYYASIDYNF